MNKIYLIDGMSLVFRAFHALSSSNFKAPNGEPTGAVFGFTNIISNILDKEKPDFIAVAFDTRVPTFRHHKFDFYKANRADFPLELEPQLPRIKKLIDLLGIAQFELPGFEADDIIGTISYKLGVEDNFIYCITSDKDYFQLINDNVSVMRPSSKQGQDFDLISFDGVEQKFGVKPEQVIDVLSLTGDAVDNIPGVKGIGDKTAIPLIQEFGSLDLLYENLDKVQKDSVRNKLLSDKINAYISKELVTIDLNVPIDFELESFRKLTPKYSELDVFFKDLGFTKIRTLWNNKALMDKSYVPSDLSQNSLSDNSDASVPNSDASVPNSDVSVPNSDASNSNFNFHLLNFETFEDLNNIELIFNKFSKEKYVCFDFIFSDSNRQLAFPLCLLVYSENVGAYAFKLNANDFPSNNSISSHQDSSMNSLFADDSLFGASNLNSDKNLSNSDKNSNIQSKTFFDIAKIVFQNADILKISDNIKYQEFILKQYNFEFDYNVFDISIASYLINPDDNHNLSAIAQKWLNQDFDFNSIAKSKENIDFEFSPNNIIFKSSANKLSIYFALFEKMDNEIKSLNLNKLAYDVEFPLIKVLTEIEVEGVRIDSKSLHDISIEMEKHITELKSSIYEEAGIDFNIDSPKQLAHILFEKLSLPAVKKTKTGFSTDMSVLTELSGANPIIDFLIDYRQITKLKSTYIDALPKLVNKFTNKIHTTFNQTIASTGRLSSTEPNLQNIPIRSAQGKEIRKAFIPSNPSNYILSADYSQIELRIMAYYSKDESLKNAFLNNQDIHTSTAAKLFDIDADKVDSEMRRVAKAVNFGIMYGLGAFGLAQGLKINRNRATSIINNYFQKYPGIKQYIDNTILQTKLKGFAETLMNRRRYFPDIKHKNQNIRTAAERAAINLPIQGTASDMIKIAMLNIFNAFKKHNIQSKMILQVHDEIVIDLLPSEEELVKQIVEKEMIDALKIGDIPIKVEIGIGKNWLEAH